MAGAADCEWLINGLSLNLRKAPMAAADLHGIQTAVLGCHAQSGHPSAHLGYLTYVVSFASRKLVNPHLQVESKVRKHSTATI